MRHAWRQGCHEQSGWSCEVGLMAVGQDVFSTVYGHGNNGSGFVIVERVLYYELMGYRITSHYQVQDVSSHGGSDTPMPRGRHLHPRGGILRANRHSECDE